MTIEDLAASSFDPDVYPKQDRKPGAGRHPVCAVSRCGVKYPAGAVCGACRVKVRELRAAKKTLAPAGAGPGTPGPVPPKG